MLGKFSLEITWGGHQVAAEMHFFLGGAKTHGNDELPKTILDIKRQVYHNHSPHQLIETQQNKNTVYNTARVIFITKQGTGTDISVAVSTGAFVDVSDVTCSFTGSTDANLWVEDGRLALFLLSLQWKKNSKPKYQGSGYSNWHWLNSVHWNFI